MGKGIKLGTKHFARHPFGCGLCCREPLALSHRSEIPVFGCGKGG